MRLLPAAVELFLCPPYSWRIELRSPLPPADCATLLAERRAKNLVEDLFRRPGRNASELRWTGSVSDGRFDIVEAGGAGVVRAIATIHSAPGGSTIQLTFRLETRQFIWDLLLFVVGAYLLFASTIAAFIAVGVAVLLALAQLNRRSHAGLDASRLVGLVQDATKGEISKAEGGARIKPPS